MLAREAITLLTWDDGGNLCLLNRHGSRQAHRPFPGQLVGACAADDGSAYAAIGPLGEVHWLAPDLTERWHKAYPTPLVAAALDPFGQYLAVCDGRGHLRIMDRKGKRVMTANCPRPLLHLAFVPTAPFLIGAADFGLVACFDLTGQCIWRAGLVAHVGSLAVSETGSTLALACFTEGIQRYDLAGKSLGRHNPGTGCRLAALTMDGQRSLVAGLGPGLLLSDANGKPVASGETELPSVALALAALGDIAYVALPDGRVQAFQL